MIAFATFSGVSGISVGIFSLTGRPRLVGFLVGTVKAFLL